jgi:CMP-N,N'-diacetyllegionaminic acid synthase
MRVLGLIPARGGSRGIPRKNIKMLRGKPLVWYTAAAALAARYLSRVILSTEDEEIAEVGQGCGLEVPFMRPLELAGDETPTLDVVLHAVSYLEQRGERYDAFCLLQPTNPLRRSEDIDRCIELLKEREASAVVSILPIPAEYHPFWSYIETEDGHITLVTGELNPVTRRQDLPPAYYRDGSVYVTRRDVLVNERSLFGRRLVGYPMDPKRHVNIDTQEDWDRAEALLESQ